MRETPILEDLWRPVGFPCSSVSKESACSAGHPGSIPGLGRSPGEGNGNPLQYSCLENSMDWEAPQSLVGYSSWGRKELDTTERLHLLTHLIFHCKYIHFLHSSTDGHLGTTFCLLWIITTCVQMSFWDSVFSSFGYILKSEVDESYSNSIFNF